MSGILLLGVAALMTLPVFATLLVLAGGRGGRARERRRPPRPVARRKQPLVKRGPSPAQVEDLTRLLAPALELASAYSLSDDDPDFFWGAVERVVNDALEADNSSYGVAELILGLSALNGILLGHISESDGAEPCQILSEVYYAYLAPGPAQRD